MDVAAGRLTADRPGILLLENDPAIRRPLQLLLEARGFAVRSHTTQAAMIADGRSSGAQLLIAHHRGIDCDALALLAHLRARNWRGPAIMLLDDCSEALRARALEAGFDEILDASSRQGDLVTLAARLIAQRVDRA